MFKMFNPGKKNESIRRILIFMLSLCVLVMLSGFLAVSAEDNVGAANDAVVNDAGAANGAEANDIESTTEPAGGMGQWLNPIIMIALFGGLMYFMLYRPQKKQEKAINEMRNSLKVGDEISTTGGILGKIVQIKEDFLIIETGNDRTKLKISKWAVRAIEHREEDDEDEEE